MTTPTDPITAPVKVANQLFLTYGNNQKLWQNVRAGKPVTLGNITVQAADVLAAVGTTTAAIYDAAYGTAS